MFRKKQAVLDVIIQRPTDVPSPDDAAAIATLNGQAGWDALLRRLAFQRQVLQSRLSKPFHKSLREVDALQIGLMWLGYLEEECRRATNSIVPSKHVGPTESEVEEFNKINAFIERVGSPQD